MSEISCFPPISDKTAKILILGSMPSVASLKKEQYYGHPHNQFWKIMMALLDAPPGLVYEERAKVLKAHNIALWDVLASCIREGSLDSAIQQETPNNFEAFFKTHPHLTHIFFNGKKAEKSFRKQVLPKVDCSKYDFYGLPSTSPANASYTFQRKYEEWQKILEVL